MLTEEQRFYSLDKANEMADELNAGDDDWTYTVVDCENGWAYIAIYDETGAFVGRL